MVEVIVIVVEMIVVVAEAVVMMVEGADSGGVEVMVFL